MNRYLFLYIATVLLGIFLQPVETRAQVPNVDELFVHAPRKVMPLLDMSARLDLLDLYNNHLTAKVENNCGGQTELLDKTSTSLSLRTSDVGQWQMNLLCAPSDTLILALHTVQACGKSTRISLYDVHWAQVACELPQPAVPDFWCPPVGWDANQLLVRRKQVEMLPVCAEWDDSTRVLTYVLNTDGADQDSRKLLDKCTCPVKYKVEWSGGRFTFIQL